MNNLIVMDDQEESQVFNIDGEEVYFKRNHRYFVSGHDGYVLLTASEGEPIFGEFVNEYLKFDDLLCAQSWLDSNDELG